MKFVKKTDFHFDDWWRWREYRLLLEIFALSLVDALRVSLKKYLKIESKIRFKIRYRGCGRAQLWIFFSAD